MKNIFACVGGYGGYEHIMYEHLSSIGVNHLQIPAPSPSEVEGVKAELDGHGFAAVALTAKYQDEDTTATDAATADWMDAFDAASRMGVSIVHSSVKAHPRGGIECLRLALKDGGRSRCARHYASARNSPNSAPQRRGLLRTDTCGGPPVCPDQLRYRQYLFLHRRVGCCRRT